MRKVFAIAFLQLFFAISLFAAQPVERVDLWKGEKVRHGAETVLECYKPEKPNGIAAIVCPGGSYCWIAKGPENQETAQWLCDNGITAFVLSYRTAGFGAYFFHYRQFVRGVRYPDMIVDAQRALQWVHDHSVEYGLDEDRIGMIGYSAGGHLVMSAACFSSIDYLEQEHLGNSSCRKPAFVAPIYPVVTMEEPYVHKRSRRALLGDDHQRDNEMKKYLSLEFDVPEDCPPVFLVNCRDDATVDYHNSELLDSALVAANVRHKYLQYGTGGHGFGASELKGTDESRAWKNEFLKWLSEIFE